MTTSQATEEASRAPGLHEEEPGKGAPGTAVQKALDVLLVLAEAPGEMRLTDIARVLSASKSTTHRVLSSLVSSGFASYVADRKTYQLGGRSLQVGLAVLERLTIRDTVRGTLEQLRDLTGETASFHIRVGRRFVGVESATSHLQPKRFVDAGYPIPLHEGPAGIVMLALGPEALWEEYRDNETVAASVEEFELLERSAQQAQQEGYCIHLSFHGSPANSVAFPLMNLMGEVLGALAVTGPGHRWTGERIAQSLEACRELVAGLSERVAHAQPLYID